MEFPDAPETRGLRTGGGSSGYLTRVPYVALRRSSPYVSMHLGVASAVLVHRVYVGLAGA